MAAKVDPSDVEDVPWADGHIEDASVSGKRTRSRHIVLARSLCDQIAGRSQAGSGHSARQLAPFKIPVRVEIATAPQFGEGTETRTS